MALSGNVETIGMDSVFLFISTNCLSGLFRIKAEEGELTFCFDNGDIFFPKTSRRTTYSLSGVLRKSSKISQNLLEKHGRNDDSLANALIAEGSLTEEELNNARRAQFEEEIYDLFLWSNAYFEFKPGEIPENFKFALEKNNGFRLNTPSLLMEAARRADDMSRIRATVPSLKTIYRVCDGQESLVDEELKKARIEGTHRSIDGRVPIGKVLKDWSIPFTSGLNMVANMVERKAITAIDRDAADTLYMISLEQGQIEESLDMLSYLIDTEEEGPNRLSLGPEDALIQTPAYHEFELEASYEVKMLGARLFKVVRAYFMTNKTFTITVRRDQHEKTISRAPHQLTVSSSKRAATPKLIHYLQKNGAVSEKEAKALWSMSGKKLFNTLLGEGRISKEQWLQALAEKVSEEIVELFFWAESQVEICNREITKKTGPKPMKINLPLDASIVEQVGRSLTDFEDITKVVPSESAIFLRRHENLPPPHPFYKRFDERKPLAEIRKHARAGPIEFFNFVFNGVKKRILRPIMLQELVKGIEEALASGNLIRAVRYKEAILTFELQNLVPDVVTQVERQTSGLEQTEIYNELTGGLQHFSLAEILQTLTQGAFTGTLQLRDANKNEQPLYFYRGQLYHLTVEEENDDDFLGLFGGDSGESLKIEEDFFSDLTDDDAMNNDLLDQVRESILNVFFWKKARFTFIRNFLPDIFWEAGSNDKVKKQPLDTQAFLLVVLGKLRQLDEIRKVIPNEETLLEFVSTDEKMNAISAGEYPEVVMIIDGRHTVQQLSNICTDSRFNLYKFLFRLIEENVLKVSHGTDFAKAWDQDGSG